MLSRAPSGRVPTGIVYTEPHEAHPQPMFNGKHILASQSLRGEKGAALGDDEGRGVQLEGSAMHALGQGHQQDGHRQLPHQGAPVAQGADCALGCLRPELCRQQRCTLGDTTQSGVTH